MPKVTMSTPVATNADQLWQAVGQFRAIADWHPMIEKAEIEGEGKGSIRTLHLMGGGTITERLEELSPTERIYRYSIVQSELPVADYEGEIRVKDNGDGTSTVEWSSDFQPKGTADQDAVKAIEAMYQAGLDNIQKLYGLRR